MASRRGLAKLLNTAKLICKVIGQFGPALRVVVPDDDKAAYDAALAAVTAACTIILAIDYTDS